MTQRELASAVGIDVRQIKRYEAGDASPTFNVAQRLASSLRITLDELQVLMAPRIVTEAAAVVPAAENAAPTALLPGLTVGADREAA